ncbi:MAG TPA: 50S ribosomal protein L25 [Vicinamibacterales bacterium]|jgi:large subunit ribosomal protein L25|nr:50S ribosomal protein L25 [Vicinamibacterales bacterium]
MEAVLEAVRRDQFGRNNAGRLRREGRIPAVIYGQASAAESVAVDPKSLLRILHSQGGANTLIALKLEGGGDLRVLVKEYQLDPVSHGLLHADFYRVAMDRVIRVTVPIHLTGEAKSAKAEGGIVDFVHRELVVECLPGDIPESIAVDVTELMLHDGVRVRDIATGGTWKPVSDADMLIVHVVAPKTEAEPAAAEATAAAAPAAAAEPEVIKKGKTEKEDEKA